MPPDGTDSTLIRVIRSLRGIQGYIRSSPAAKGDEKIEIKRKDSEKSQISTPPRSRLNSQTGTGASLPDTPQSWRTSISKSLSTSWLPFQTRNPDELPEQEARKPEPERKSWAFWSRYSGKNEYSEDSEDIGELAVDGTATESDPTKAETQVKRSKSELDLRKQYSSRSSARVQSPNDVHYKTPFSNIVSPAIEACYMRYSRAGALKRRFSQLISGVPMDAAGVCISAPRTFKKAVVIGVHGFFPVRVVRTILGEPTGTSIKFADEAAESVERWAREQGIESDVSIEKIALEGEGTVEQRVDSLYKLLLNWRQHIVDADYILVAAHSQGVVVSAHILKRLIEDGLADGNNIGLLGMAGVSLGPFYGLDTLMAMKAYSTIESAALAELFEFQKEESKQSVEYRESLAYIVNHGVRVTFVGSTNDQVVPLYSSLCMSASHPGIFRAAFMDRKIHNDDNAFLTSLIGFVLRLGNRGHSDYGVIKALSQPLAGTLTGSGHSLLYMDPCVYDLAVRHSLETSITDWLPKMTWRPIDAKESANPYLLPWSMRGLFDDAFTKTYMKKEIDGLIDQLANWKPASKGMKELKYRLSGISSKL
ncbi:hypothetical protein CANCADRAFT_30090 [Tortispora caseinolytica NRRL Y-17796]|uniref:YMC020W-like alpha/beta hydrolase domain-containing protein n=1 Tax=Tortispora caseinolytica NRRL Y-17796 TaxID=767744 RepID=A0A1E4TJ22_9ASCO|nr:hypothetical protein CANCADRAFT_30090 [Tortispora caseinolytica NRRL Y-17796]